MIVIRRAAARSFDNRHDVEAKGSEATIYLYGDIGGWFGIDSKEFIQEFNEIDAKTIHLRVDSAGGDVFSARAIKTAIVQHEATVIAHVDGLAASAASFLIMGADEIEIVDGGFLMIHNSRSFLDVFGYFALEDLEKLIEDFEKEKKLHEKINDALASDYAKRTGKNKAEILDLMSEETWFTAAEAVEEGFADRVYDAEVVEGSYDLSTFANTPKAIQERNKKFSKRTVEAALRNVGLSEDESKKILAEGYQEKKTKEDLTERDIEKALRDAGCSRSHAKKIMSEGFTASQDERDAHKEGSTQEERDAHLAESNQREAVTPGSTKDNYIDIMARTAAIPSSQTL